MRQLTFFILFFSFNCFGQSDSLVLVIGNYKSICALDSVYHYSDSLPEKITGYSTIWVFSSSTSRLKSIDLQRLTSYIEDGGGLYIGSENWPLQAEANQITQEIYLKSSFGNYQASQAEICTVSGNLRLDSLDSLPAGKTIVAFPMDYRLKVEAWVSDQPLILSGELGKGHIIIDGGYSRFYCDQRSYETDMILKAFFDYLNN